jgi:hypothetical protein
MKGGQILSSLLEAVIIFSLTVTGQVRRVETNLWESNILWNIRKNWT